MFYCENSQFTNSRDDTFQCVFLSASALNSAEVMCHAPASGRNRSLAYLLELQRSKYTVQRCHWKHTYRLEWNPSAPLPWWLVDGLNIDMEKCASGWFKTWVMYILWPVAVPVVALHLVGQPSVEDVTFLVCHVFSQRDLANISWGWSAIWEPNAKIQYVFSLKTRSENDIIFSFHFQLKLFFLCNAVTHKELRWLQFPHCELPAPQQ